MKNHQKIIENIEQIKKWIISAPNPKDFISNNDFMKFIVELMSNALYLLKIGIVLVPSKKLAKFGYTKHKAIILGLMVRIYKLYEGLIIHTSKVQLELSAIFTRLIYETDIKIEYLLGVGRTSYKNFIFTSYKSEKEILQDFDEIKTKRPLIPIERRIRRKIISRLRNDHITLKELYSNRNWKLDGKDFRGLLRSLNRDKEYALFGQSSHPIHGTWYELSLYHLKKDGRYYTPDIEYDVPDPRLTCPITHLVLLRLYKYIQWTKSDPDNYILPVVRDLIKLSLRVDREDESRRPKF